VAAEPCAVQRAPRHPRRRRGGHPDAGHPGPEGTTITRLLDKLEEAGLIRRERSYPDRRQVICQATPKGKRLLDELDPLVDEADETAVASLTPAQVEELVHLLDEVRASNAVRGAARSGARSE
jgi:DNA-binding PadR family transcriptional regulator